jgi:hypothetical protein
MPLKKLFIFQAYLGGFLGGLILLVVLAGNALYPSRSVLEDTANCRLPCWNDIRPGETGLVEADSAVVSLGYLFYEDFPINRVRSYSREGVRDDCLLRLAYSRGYVTSITFTDCGDFQLGDVILLLGTPQDISRLGTTLAFHNEEIAATIRYTDCTHGLSPYTPIASVFLRPLDANARLSITENGGNFEWIGFAPWWRYRQFNSGLYGC